MNFGSKPLYKLKILVCIRFKLILVGRYIAQFVERVDPAEIVFLASTLIWSRILKYVLKMIPVILLLHYLCKIDDV